MRRKLYFCAALAIFGIVAAGFTFSQSIGAQDAPKKAEKKTDQDLFDILQQKFANPDVPALPPPSKGIVDPLPPLLKPGGSGQVAPLPAPKASDPILSIEKAAKVQQSGSPTPPTNWTVPQDLPKAAPAPKARDDAKPSAVPTAPPSIPPSTDLPQVRDLPPQQPKQDAAPQKPPVVVEPSTPLNDANSGAIPPFTPPVPTPQLLIQDAAPQKVPVPAQPQPNEPIKLKGSAWSLYVEMVNGQTVVTATVNKKHEFKIVCQHVDLQTSAGVMKAKGKVQITGENLDATCDQLTLPLHDDRLMLEGAAEVRIQKATAASFELKGDKLDLRTSELRSSAYIETGLRKAAGDSSEGRAIPASMTRRDDATAWTPYGKLGNIKANEPNTWSLVSDEGQVIAYVMARDGGSLEQYVGRTIAVYGAREGKRGGYPLVRVTHIAVP